MKWTGFFLLLTSLLRASAQDHMALSYTAPDLSYYQLKGPIATVQQYASGSELFDISSLAALGISGLDSTKELILHFDSTGKGTYKSEKPLIETSKKDKKYTECQYRYSNGVLINQVLIQDSSPADSIVFDYNRRNKISSYTVYNSKARVQYKYTFTYNSHQQLITIRRKNEENFPVEMIKLKYDDEGALTQQQFFDDNMKKVKTIEFNDQLSDSTGYHNGTILTYNDTNQLVSGIMAVRTAEGLLLEQSVIDSTKKVTSYHTLRYNEQQDIEEEKLFANMENITATYKYTYDEHDNWTEKIVTINGNPVLIINRTFKYY